MRRSAFLTVALVAAACLVTSGSAAAAPARQPAPAEDEFTSVIASTLDAGMAPVLGTDGKRHVVYELQLTNAKPVPATLQEIQVLDAARPTAAPIATFTGDDLRHRLRTLTGHVIADPTLAEDVSRLVLVDLTFPANGPLPAKLTHRLKLTGQPVTGGDTPRPLDYTAATFVLSGQPAWWGRRSRARAGWRSTAAAAATASTATPCSR
jgi:hypothetical protein